MPIVERILNRMDDSREARYTQKTRPEIWQMNGFREEWAEYVQAFVDEGNADRG